MTLKKLIKAIYSVIPFKREVYSVLKSFYTPPESIYKHLYFKDVFTIKVTENKKFKMIHHGNIEENEIFWNGLFLGWEKKSITLWAELCKNANVIFDIGANTGLYSLIASTVNTNATVHSFEPIVGVFQILKKNIALNNFEIKPHQIALSDYDGKAKIYMPKGKTFTYSVTVNKNTLGKREATVFEINVQKLASFIEFEKIREINLMKIDVETHEVEVLNGMEDYLKLFQPTIIIEVLSDEIALKLNKIVANFNYLYFNIDDENNSIRKVDKISKSDYWNFLLCNEQTARNLKLI